MQKKSDHEYTTQPILFSKNYVPVLILIYSAYFITAKLGLKMDAVSGFATLVWAPSGIALAAVLLAGYRVWPAISLAAFLVNFQNDASFSTACAISAGNTLEPLLGAYLLNRFTDFHKTLDRKKDVFSFLVAVIIGCAVSATGGAISTALGGVRAWEGFFETWKAWWVGDVVGSILIAPVILVCLSHARIKFNFKKTIEAALLGISLVTVCILVLRNSSQDPLSFKFLLPLFPFIVWSALRFRQIGNVIVMFFITLFTIFITSKGWGPFNQGPLVDNLYVVNSFLGISAITGLFLSATIMQLQQKA